MQFRDNLTVPNKYDYQDFKNKQYFAKKEAAAVNK